MESRQHTFDAQVTEVPLKVIDGRKKDLYMKGDFLGHSDRLQGRAVS